MPRPIRLLDELSIKHPKWNRIEHLMKNDERKFREEPFAIQLPNESAAAFDDRRRHFARHFINMTQDLIAAPGDAIFSNGVKLEFEKENSMLADFAENVTLGNDPMPWTQYLRDFFATNLRAYGTVVTVVDKPKYNAKSRADERTNGMPYLSNIRLQNILNYRFKDGVLQWIAYKKKHQPEWLDPINEDEPSEKDMTCVWTPTQFICYDEENNVNNELSFDHNWGFVPVVIQSSFLPSPMDVLGVSAFEQTSNMMITFNNLLGVAVWEMYKHGASLLLMHEESISAMNQTTDDSGNTELKKQDKGTMLGWSGDHEPAYLVKELAVKEAMEMAEFYQKALIDNERDLKSVAKKSTGDPNVEESGFAKMINREPMVHNLKSLAVDTEMYSKKIMWMAAKILNQENDSTLEFDKDYDLRSFEQKLVEIEKAQKTRMREVTKKGEAEMWRNVVPEITVDEEVQQQINDEITEWEETDQEEEFNTEIKTEIDNLIKNNSPDNEKKLDNEMKQ